MLTLHENATVAEEYVHDLISTQATVLWFNKYLGSTVLQKFCVQKPMFNVSKWSTLHSAVQVRRHMEYATNGDAKSARTFPSGRRANEEIMSTAFLKT